MSASRNRGGARERVSRSRKHRIQTTKPRARLRPASAGAVSPSPDRNRGADANACAQFCAPNRPARQPRICRRYLSFQLSSHIRAFALSYILTSKFLFRPLRPWREQSLLNQKSTRTVSLPRPAPTRVGAATAGKIKNPTSKITNSPLPYSFFFALHSWIRFLHSTNS